MGVEVEEQPEVALRVDSVSKTFKVHSERASSLKQFIASGGRNRYEEFTALDNVSDGLCESDALPHALRVFLDLPVARLVEPDVVENLMGSRQRVPTGQPAQLTGVGDESDARQAGDVGVRLRHVANPASEPFERVVNGHSGYGKTDLGDWPDLTPEDVFAKTDVHAYCDYIDARVSELVALTPFGAESGFSWLKFSKGEAHLYNLRHIQHHTGQLTERLRQEAGISSGRWVFDGR